MKGKVILLATSLFTSLALAGPSDNLPIELDAVQMDYITAGAKVNARAIAAADGTLVSLTSTVAASSTGEGGFAAGAAYAYVFTDGNKLTKTKVNITGVSNTPIHTTEIQESGVGPMTSFSVTAKIVIY